MRVVAIVLALAVGGAFSASAATRSFEAVVTDFTDSGNLLASIGADPDASELVFSWTIEESPQVLVGPGAYNLPSIGGVYDLFGIAYSSFSVSVGGVTLNGLPPRSGDDEITIRDDVLGLVGDRFVVRSKTDQSGPMGTTIERISLIAEGDYTTFGRALNDPLFSGLEHPTAEQLNALSNFTQASILIFGGQERIAAITGSNPTFSETTLQIAAVPIPPALLMMICAFASFFVFRRIVW